MNALLWIHQWHNGLEPSEGIGPGIAEGSGAVLGQVFLSEKTEETEHPGVFDRLSKYPDM